MPVPVKTNGQICQDSFGINSIWDGTKNNDGTVNCQCKIGYAWNSGKTACEIVVNPFPAGCTSSVGFSATSGLSCDGTKKCSDNLQLNNNKTECVPIPKKESSKVEFKTPSTTITTNKETETSGVAEIEQKEEASLLVSPEPTKKAPWYKRLFNWLLY